MDEIHPNVKDWVNCISTLYAALGYGLYPLKENLSHL